jgi:ATP synthase protein I
METDKNKTSSFSADIAAKEKRKLKAQLENKNVWFGLGMFGMVGWSVVVPALLGALLGIWLDKTHPVPFSWTLSCLIIGLCGGCLIAWYWISSEDKQIH